MADYENDIFISYRRSDVDWVRWTRENFVRALTSLLRVRLGVLKVFVDETIEDGASWPNHLAMSLSRSRIMVAVLSRDYFQSDWCRLELALMHHREKAGNLRCAANPWGLIIPVVIDDGNCFPPEVQAMQGEPLHAFANPFMRPDSPKQEAMAEVLRSKLCASIERALLAVPAFDPAWEQIAHKQFEGVFQIHMQSQKTVPSLVLPIS
jgi:TIR domain